MAYAPSAMPYKAVTWQTISLGKVTHCLTNNYGKTHHLKFSMITGKNFIHMFFFIDKNFLQYKNQHLMQRNLEYFSLRSLTYHTIPPYKANWKLYCMHLMPSMRRS